MDEIITALEKTLDSLLPQTPGHREKLYNGARYLLFAPSKRIRPLFVVEVASLFEVPLEKSLYPAAALELLHTYSLIHDDLPCMDDDDMRRGQPALHKIYDEATALLIGDFLLTYSFEILTKAPGLSSEQKIALVASLSQYGGGEGIVGGQLMDLASAPRQETHARKTAALFIAAFEFGAIIGQVSSEIKNYLKKIGEKIGLLFQLVDDFIDGDFPPSEERGQEITDLFDESKALLEALPASESLLSIVKTIIRPTNKIAHLLIK